MTSFVYEQFSFTTAEMEAVVFAGESSHESHDPPPALPDGVYRVLAGHLYRVLDSLPTEMQVHQFRNG